MKTWDDQPFWGLGEEWDPDWLLTSRQRELRDTLIGLCEQEIRGNAERSDDELRFPRRNLELLGEHGFLALTVPKEYGGLGGDHTTFAVACETIARYGCASTAMCFVMHIVAVQAIVDRATDSNRRVLEPGIRARADYLHWCWQVKYTAAKNVTAVVDRMLHACGGSGYRRDLGLERYLRDGKAGWVMGPSNEVLRQFVGRSALFGFSSLDYWNRTVDERALRNETGKLDPATKRALAARLLAEAEATEQELTAGSGTRP